MFLFFEIQLFQKINEDIYVYILDYIFALPTCSLLFLIRKTQNKNQKEGREQGKKHKIITKHYKKRERLFFCAKIVTGRKQSSPWKGNFFLFLFIYLLIFRTNVLKVGEYFLSDNE